MHVACSSQPAFGPVCHTSRIIPATATSVEKSVQTLHDSPMTCTMYRRCLARDHALTCSVMLILALAVPSQSTHFRHGQISWVRLSPNSNAVRIFFASTWRRSYFDPLPVIGSNITLTPPKSSDSSGGLLIAPNIGGSTVLPVTATTTAVNLGENTVLAEFAPVYTLPKGAVTVQVRYSGCCRLSSLQSGNNDTAYYLKATIDLRNGNMGSPVTPTVPKQQMYQNVLNRYQLSITDPDRTNTTVTIMPGGVTGSGLAVAQPAGLTVSPQGLITWKPTVLGVYAVQVRLTQQGPNGVFVPIDFIIEVVPKTSVLPTCNFDNLPATCIATGSTATCTALPGSELMLNMLGRDPGQPAGPLTLSYSGIVVQPTPIVHPADGVTVKSPINASIIVPIPYSAAGTTRAIALTFVKDPGPQALSITCSFTLSVNNAVPDACTTGPCHSSATCSSDGVGFAGFTCSCAPGYSGNGSSGKDLKCTEVDECAGNSSACGQNAVCINAPGSYSCSCEEGYIGNGLNGTNLICTDIDECVAHSNACNDNAVCVNTPGAFNCFCKEGYISNGLSGAELMCNDIDECTRNPCDTNVNCLDRPGGFVCVCKDGYTGNGVNGSGLVCADIDECASKVANYSNNADCINMPGNYYCACKDGYIGLSVNDSDINCVDIDECVAGSTRVCDDNAVCINAPGTFTCTCKEGYSSNGLTGTDLICINIDECADSSACGDNTLCTDTMGGFTCACKKGFIGNVLNGSNLVCTDIDECAGNNSPCSNSAVCINTPGSFRCSCMEGYISNGLEGSSLQCTQANGDGVHRDAPTTPINESAVPPLSFTSSESPATPLEPPSSTPPEPVQQSSPPMEPTVPPATLMASPPPPTEPATPSSDAAEPANPPVPSAHPILSNTSSPPTLQMPSTQDPSPPDVSMPSAPPLPHSTLPTMSSIPFQTSTPPIPPAAPSESPPPSNPPKPATLLYTPRTTPPMPSTPAPSPLPSPPTPLVSRTVVPSMAPSVPSTPPTAPPQPLYITYPTPDPTIATIPLAPKTPSAPLVTIPVPSVPVVVPQPLVLGQLQFMRRLQCHCSQQGFGSCIPGSKGW